MTPVIGGSQSPGDFHFNPQTGKFELSGGGSIGAGNDQVYVNPNYQAVLVPPVIPTIPAQGSKITPGAKQLILTPEVTNTSIAAGGTLKLDLGEVVDIIQLGTALGVGKINLTVPRMYEADLEAFTRAKNDPRTLQLLPAGEYVLENPTAGALTPTVVFWHWKEY